jgi:hypothetical protein
VIKEPKETKSKSFNDIFSNNYDITYRTIRIKLFFDLIGENAKFLKIINGKYEKDFKDQCLIGYGSSGRVYKVKLRIDAKVYAI